MDISTGGLLLGGIILFLAVPAILDFMGRPSREGRRKAAKALGLEYVAASMEEPPRTELRPMLWAEAIGKQFVFTNLMRGGVGDAEVQLFDLETRARGYKQDHRLNFQTVALFRSRKTFPLFTLVPWKSDDSPHRVAIDLPFLKTHALLAADKAPAADLFLRLSPGFLSGAGWLIEGGGNWVMVCRFKQVVVSDKLGDFLAEAGRILDELQRAA